MLLALRLNSLLKLHLDLPIEIIDTTMVDSILFERTLQPALLRKLMDKQLRGLLLVHSKMLQDHGTPRGPCRSALKQVVPENLQIPGVVAVSLVLLAAELLLNALVLGLDEIGHHPLGFLLIAGLDLEDD